jgi:arylsulfatase A-like enzyme
MPQNAAPNIVVIMGDDIGWFNLGSYHQGMMAGRTPNLDRMAAEGIRFTDYYDQTSLMTGKGPSNRHEIFYFAEGTLGAIRFNRSTIYRFVRSRLPDR